jgi:lipopolysaccharide transport system permease protein
LYATPIAYPASVITANLPAWASYVYYLNPMAGVVEGFRWCLLGGEAPSMLSYVSFGIIALLFVTGLLYFKKVERVMADIV